MIGQAVLVLIDLLLEAIELVGQPTHQVIDPTGHVAGEIEHQVFGALGTNTGLQVFLNFGGSLHRPHAQGDHPAFVDEYPQRDHVFGNRTGVEIHPTQEEQQAVVGLSDQSRPSGFFEQQIASEFAQATGLAQPGLGLGDAAVPVQPQHLAGARLDLRQLPPAQSSSATTAIEEIAIDEALFHITVVLLHLPSRAGIATGWIGDPVSAALR